MKEYNNKISILCSIASETFSSLSLDSPELYSGALIFFSPGRLKFDEDQIFTIHLKSKETHMVASINYSGFNEEKKEHEMAMNFEPILSRRHEIFWECKNNIEKLILADEKGMAICRLDGKKAHGFLEIPKLAIKPNETYRYYY